MLSSTARANRAEFEARPSATRNGREELVKRVSVVAKFMEQIKHFSFSFTIVYASFFFVACPQQQIVTLSSANNA